MAFCPTTSVSEVHILDGPIVNDYKTLLIDTSKDSFQIDTKFGTAVYYVYELDEFKYLKDFYDYRPAPYRYALFKYFDWGF